MGKDHRFIDITGRRFGRLVVTRLGGRYVPPSGISRQLWVCACDCGAIIETLGPRLRAGRAKSCGLCIHKTRESPRLRHGHNRKGKTTAEYRSWGNIKKRCFDPTNKSFANYGGRGITMADEWKDSFDAFLMFIGPRPGPGYSVERVNNSLGYVPGNVRWATKMEQANNTRSNVYIEVLGRRQTVAQWALAGFAK